MMNDQQLTIELMREGLDNLNPMELQEIDEVITPRAAELLSKAFGPAMWDLLGPLTEDDNPEDLAKSEAALRKMMQDPRYWREKDPEIVDKVSRGFQRLYPDDAKPEKDDFVR